MKKAFLFLALCLLGAGRAAAAEPVDSVRNVIYMIGDGMGLAHVSMLAVEGGYAPTAFDRAQGIALISTYSANNRVTDSAAAGTALACGSKTNNGTLGLDPRGGRLQSLIEWAVAEGMPAGIAVKCHLQHATPAAFYAHVPDRGDEKAITRDLLASNIDVLIGAGRRLEKESPEGGSYRDAFGRRGFVLMVEGSLIDGASHGNDAEKILAEMRDFERAVAAAMDFADRTPGTLVVVTADHETGGLAIPSCDGDFTRSESGIRSVFGSKSHTATYVPVYLYGTGAGHIAGIMDNTQLARRVMALLGKE